MQLKSPANESRLQHKSIFLSLTTLFSLVLMAVTLPSAAQTGVRATLPNGREIRPEGNWITVAPFPFALAVRPDGNQLAVPSIGWPFSLNLVDAPAGSTPKVRRYPEGHENDPAIETHAGVAYSLDGQTLYLASGDSGKVKAYRAADFKLQNEASLNGEISATEDRIGTPKIAKKTFSASFAATLILSHDGKLIYALDQANWRIVILDAGTLKPISSVPTGSYPFGLALSPDGARLYVTNTGLFEYQLVGGIDKNDLLGTALKFAPTAYPSKEAREGTVVDGHAIPALGDENSVRGSSLWTYDVHDPSAPAITAKLRLGERITEKIGATLGGAAPTGVVATADHVYVSLAHEDEIVELTSDGSKLVRQVELSPFTGPRFVDAKGRPLRGVIPSGLALASGHLYVAESGIDAVADIDLATLKVSAHIPVGWNPSAIALSPDGTTLYAINTKGKGTGPNGGKSWKVTEPTYVGDLEFGSVSVIRLADLAEPAELTRRVIANNEAAILKADPLPHLKHCFFVIRENRTYDEVLGDITTANGDPSLARFGVDGWAEESESAVHLKVTPNLHALAAQFAFSDNYFVDSDVSADGHRWALGINPTPFFNTAWTSGYGGRRSGSSADPQPGRRAMFGGADSPMPEDEPQFGSLWEHIVAGGKSILNYGEGLEVEGNEEMNGAEPEGQRMLLNAPLPKPIFEGSDRRYPTFNLGIPDQFRAAEFERDFKRRLAQGKIPEFIVIRLPNDHTTDGRPNDGYPYRASFVADNDLALGKIVDFLSRTSIWKDSAFFVTEDDSQGGVDHVDAHRSILFIASPWVKPGSVSHNHTSMGSITHTISELLGLGPLNLEDSLAGEINGVFDTTPHAATFNFLASDPRVFDPAKAKLAHPKTRQEAAALKDVDDADEIRKELEKSGKKLKKPVDKD